MRLYLVAVLLIATAGFAQPWRQFGPRGLSVAAMARVPGFADEIYAVSDGVPALVLFSLNGGASWTVRDTIYDRVTDLVVGPDDISTLYAGGISGRVWRSIDNGRSWFLRGRIPGDITLRRLVGQPGEPGFLRAAVELSGVNGGAGLGFRFSDDGGASWTGTIVDSGFAVSAYALDYDRERPNRVFLGGSVDHSARLFFSGDGGNAWVDITGALDGDCAWGTAVSPIDPMVLLAATDAGIWRSTTGGGGWALMESVPAWSVGFAPVSPYYAYAGSDNLVFRSNNLGMDWFADTTAFRGSVTRWLDINPRDGLDVFAGNGRGAFRTTNGGFNWTELTGGMSRLTIKFARFHPVAAETVFTVPPGHGLLVSGDYGESWRELPGFAGAGFVTDVALNPVALDTLYAISGNDYRLYMTADRGDSWTSEVIEPGLSGRGIMFHPFGPDTMYAWGGLREAGSGMRFGFWKSADRGYNWARVFSPGSDGLCRGFRFGADGDSLFLWGGVDGRARVYLSLDRGDSWIERSAGIAGTGVNDFVVAPGENRISYLCATDAGVFRTLDGGVSWNRLGLDNVSSVLPDIRDPELIVAATDTQGLFRTTSSGSVWERDTVALPYRSLTSLARHPFDAGVSYCGTVGSGFYGRGVVGINEPEFEHRLPGPDVAPTVFRTGTVIRFATVAGRRVVVSLYSVDGRRVGPESVLERFPGAWLWERPPGLPAGVYLLRFRSEGFDSSARIVLVD